MSMSISDIRKDATCVYVINNTKTDISITVKDEDGVNRLIRILRASIPQDAAALVTAAILKRSASFKRAVANDYLRIIPEKEAKAILSTDAARMEQASIKKKLSRIPKELMVGGEEVTALEAVSGGASDTAIRSEIKDIAVDTEESADDKFARLMALDNEEKISKNEATWLISRLPTTTGVYNEIIDWLNS